MRAGSARGVVVIRIVRPSMSLANRPLAGNLPWNQSPAAAMGAESLGGVTLPVWAQPWYALSYE